MVTVTLSDPPASWLPRGRALVADDLDGAPDDGHRYELVDGGLVVSPTPSVAHQRAVLRLAMLLADPCPAELETSVAPFDVRLSADTVIQPDVLVVRRENLTPQHLPGPPVLAVEVLSPSTRGVDLLLKHDRLARAGCRSYWVVDPADDGRLAVWELGENGTYVEVADVRSDEQWTATLPYEVTITPRHLVS